MGVDVLMERYRIVRRWYLGLDRVEAWAVAVLLVGAMAIVFGVSFGLAMMIKEVWQWTR